MRDVWTRWIMLDIGMIAVGFPAAAQCDLEQKIDGNIGEFGSSACKNANYPGEAIFNSQYGGQNSARGHAGVWEETRF